MSGDTGNQPTHRLDSTVLIVDDESFIRDIVSRRLADAGCRCVQADNAAAARAHLQSTDIDVVTLDIAMPGESGIDLLKQFARDFPDVPVVMLTSNVDTSTVVTCMTHGACGYLVKPVDRDDLLFQVSSAIGHRREIVNRRRAERQLRLFNERLEERVAEKTKALDEANQNLRREIAEHQKLQCELAQAQKLESVGQLAAGIAHEINTPIQYVGDNTRFLQDAFKYLGEVLDCLEHLLEAAKDGEVAASLVEQVESAMEQADLGYLTDEIPRAIDESLVGVERVASIVRAMKEFSHPGTDEKTPIDLREAIQTTVTVARNEWKYVAEIVSEFDSELPCVPCLPGELNQVLLNLIVNAAHAIGDVVGKDGTTKGTITIGTRRMEPWAEIFVRDTGAGIPESARSRIFDPFFTTKQVGRGTGQGLAMARSVVVDKHGGTIEFDTELGKGTEFRIRFPMDEGELEEEGRCHEEAHNLCG